MEKQIPPSDLFADLDTYHDAASSPAQTDLEALFDSLDDEHDLREIAKIAMFDEIDALHSDEAQVVSTEKPLVADEKRPEESVKSLLTKSLRIHEAEWVNGHILRPTYDLSSIEVLSNDAGGEIARRDRHLYALGAAAEAVRIYEDLRAVNSTEPIIVEHALEKQLACIRALGNETTTPETITISEAFVNHSYDTLLVEQLSEMYDGGQIDALKCVQMLIALREEFTTKEELAASLDRIGARLDEHDVFTIQKGWVGYEHNEDQVDTIFWDKSGVKLLTLATEQVNTILAMGVYLRGAKKTTFNSTEARYLAAADALNEHGIYLSNWRDEIVSGGPGLCATSGSGMSAKQHGIISGLKQMFDEEAQQWKLRAIKEDCPPCAELATTFLHQNAQPLSLEDLLVEEPRLQPSDEDEELRGVVDDDQSRRLEEEFYESQAELEITTLSLDTLALDQVIERGEVLHWMLTSKPEAVIDNGYSGELSTGFAGPHEHAHDDYFGVDYLAISEALQYTHARQDEDVYEFVQGANYENDSAKSARWESETPADEVLEFGDFVSPVPIAIERQPVINQHVQQFRPAEISVGDRLQTVLTEYLPRVDGDVATFPTLREAPVLRLPSAPASDVSRTVSKGAEVWTHVEELRVIPSRAVARDKRVVELKVAPMKQAQRSKPLASIAFGKPKQVSATQKDHQEIGSAGAVKTESRIVRRTQTVRRAIKNGIRNTKLEARQHVQHASLEKAVTQKLSTTSTRATVVGTEASAAIKDMRATTSAIARSKSETPVRTVVPSTSTTSTKLKHPQSRPDNAVQTGQVAPQPVAPTSADPVRASVSAPPFGRGTSTRHNGASLQLRLRLPGTFPVDDPHQIKHSIQSILDTYTQPVQIGIAA